MQIPARLDGWWEWGTAKWGATGKAWGGCANLYQYMTRAGRGYKVKQYSGAIVNGKHGYDWIRAALPGDLIFYDTRDASGPINHVALVIVSSMSAGTRIAAHHNGWNRDWRISNNSIGYALVRPTF